MPEKIDSAAPHCKSVIFRRIVVDKIDFAPPPGFFY